MGVMVGCAQILFPQSHLLLLWQPVAGLPTVTCDLCVFIALKLVSLHDTYLLIMP